MEKMSTLMKKMNVLELIEQIVELTNDQGITTEVKRGLQQLVSPAKPYIKELMTHLGMERDGGSVPLRLRGPVQRLAHQRQGHRTPL